MLLAHYDNVIDLKMLPNSFFCTIEAFTRRCTKYWVSLQGMGSLTMSTPPVLSDVAGNCGAYKPYCIGNTQKALFYTALALVAIGISSHITSLVSFLKQQEEDNSEQLRP